MSLTSSAIDRRRGARTPLVRPAKVVCGITGRTLSARTINLSAGGALLEVAQPVRMAVGQSVHVGIAWTRHDMLLAKPQLREGRVVRCLGIEGVHQVALAFSQQEEMAATA